MAADDAVSADARQYRVLARKYRPTNFAELIGQEAMVRTLTNAIHSGRLAHAFVLTGVRGVGKTTTARIIARALNCEKGPTPDPCGVCDHCRAIAEDRHMDVIEMDAASRTGVDDIREVIEGVRYRPVSARYKVYIVDEVHMLSKSAFNALLKTLEEPPEHVKFIFATTEIRKVPVTVLSRCQRFDLRRIELEVLATHFRGIAAKEGAEIEEGALMMIARAADGSVRDGLSLLDQAIAHTAGKVAEDQVRDMLGLADRNLVFDLFDAVMGGDAKGALDQMARQYAAGADPTVVLTDLLELTHWLTRIKVVPTAADAPGVPEAERVRGRDMASRLSMAAVSRAWQMLLKGLGEARSAPSAQQAAEMALVRLAYAADLPTPAEALQSLKDKGGIAPSPPAAAGGGTQAAVASQAVSRPAPPSDAPRAALSGSGALAVAPQPQGVAETLPDPQTYKAVVDLASEKREGILHANLLNNLHLVRFEPGRIEFRPSDRAPPDLAQTLKKFLDRCTARRWMVTVTNDTGEATLAQQDAATDASLRAKAAEHPLVRAVLEIFPGAHIRSVRATADERSDIVPETLPPAPEDGETEGE
ncbi:MAG: DNA polymerase III subunit gamma/tau [Magnetospirillum sp. WYHS-4]